MFGTKSNQTTRENIANVYGAKTIAVLIPLDFELQLQPSIGYTQIIKDPNAKADSLIRTVHIIGHVSRPVFGEGRQTPDRQLFFVNGRPCGLPQVSKAFNEVYKSYNITQSPFVFADLRMDTNAYDVNVSPDKRTILLHDQSALLEALKSSLTRLFDAQDQTVPQSQLMPQRLPIFRPLTIDRDVGHTSLPSAQVLPLINATDRNMHVPNAEEDSSPIPSSLCQDQDADPTELIHKYFGRELVDRELVRGPRRPRPEVPTTQEFLPKAVEDFNARLASQHGKRHNADAIEEEIPIITTPPRTSIPGAVQLAYDRSRPKRLAQETAVITIGDKTSSAVIGSLTARRSHADGLLEPQFYKTQQQPSLFAQSLQAFAAPGTQADEEEAEEKEEDGEEDEDDVPMNENLEDELLVRLTDVLDPNEAVSDDLFHGEGIPSDNQSNSSDAGLTNGDHEGIQPLSSPQPVMVQESDDEYVDEDERKRRDAAQVEQMVRTAEAAVAQPTYESRKKAAALFRSVSRTESTVSLVQTLEMTVARISEQLRRQQELLHQVDTTRKANRRSSQDITETQTSAEERLSLTINKTDFAGMHIVGQFNLGFILATRPADSSTRNVAARFNPSDDLFIIDQHASDEIFNFHRLSASTTLTPQPLVKPHQLHLTAIEEETIMESIPTLQKNGFTLTVDESGTEPVGARCKLLALPTSRETTFDLHDLEELISLLSEAPTTTMTAEVIRPTKVRKMLAMRACRSSIMVGKTLTHPAMQRVVRHMGEIDKPWNCPHGRPTMRHLACLDTWEGWSEGDGMSTDLEDGVDEETMLGWSSFLHRHNSKRGIASETVNAKDVEVVDEDQQSDGEYDEDSTDEAGKAASEGVFDEEED